MGSGCALVLAGSLLAGPIQYALSRRLLRARVQGMINAKPSLAAIQRAVIRDEFRLQVLLRLTPLNPATVSYMLGAAGVGFPLFLLAFLASIPNLFIEVYFGHVGKHVARLASSDARTAHLHGLAIIGGLVVCIVVMILVSRIAHRSLLEAMATPASEKAEAQVGEV
nr:VTT domain-containing protein [uncultured Desulfobacter sp.]